MNPETWTGSPSIPSDYLLQAPAVRTLCSIRSDRLLMEESEFHMADRWLVGLRADEPVWDPRVFSKNRERLLEQDVARRFLEESRRIIDESGVAGDGHFSVEGTRLEARASLKSFQVEDDEGSAKRDDDPGIPTVDFKGGKAAERYAISPGQTRTAGCIGRGRKPSCRIWAVC